MTSHLPEEDYARHLDATDPLAYFRDRFLIPPGPDSQPCVYLCGHSLGLQPRAARDLVTQELDDWAALGVEGHFRGRSPWFSYHELVRDAGARLVGAEPGEVVFMNSLTVNLHLMLATFYRPTRERFRILTDEPAFPSDLYALQTHIRHRGREPADALLTVTRPEEIDETLTRHGETVAVVLLNGVNFLTGRHFDMPRIVSAAHAHGCVAGFDLAHAVGNVPLQIHA
jgi:kynureninase